MLLYIDPGTGSMLFTVLIGVVAASLFFLQKLWMRIRFFFSGGRGEKGSSDKIDYLVFGESKRYWMVFKPICEEFEKRKIPMEYWTASPDDPSLSAPWQYVRCRFIGEGNKAFAKLNLANACICLSTTPGLDVYQWRRSKNVNWYAHIFHTISEGLGYRMFGMDFYDAVLLTSPVCEKNIRTLEKLRNGKEKELPVVGCTYMDTLLQKNEEAGPWHNEETTILLAPSWGKNAILSRFGAKAIRALMDTGYRLVIRPHPQSSVSEPELLKKLQAEFPDSETLSWNFDIDNFDVLRKADLLVSDYSGVVFDFAFIFNRPVIYTDTIPDKSCHDSAWIEEPMWRFDVLPRLGRALREEDLDDFKPVIDQLLENPSVREDILAVRDEGWSCIGESAARIADYMIKKRDEIKGSDSLS